MYSVRSMPSLLKTPYTHFGVLWVFFPSMALRKENVNKGYLHICIQKNGKAQIRRIAPTYILLIYMWQFSGEISTTKLLFMNASKL